MRMKILFSSDRENIEGLFNAFAEKYLIWSVSCHVLPREDDVTMWTHYIVYVFYEEKEDFGESR